MPGLWKHTGSDLMFTLVVDDFGVRYTKKADVENLVSVLTQAYNCTVDWAGERYIVLTLVSDYGHRLVDISLAGYLAPALQRLHPPHPTSAH